MGFPNALDAALRGSVLDVEEMVAAVRFKDHFGFMRLGTPRPAAEN